MYCKYQDFTHDAKFSEVSDPNLIDKRPFYFYRPRT